MSLLINIDVPDAETATRFYTEAFGLTVGRRFGKDFVELLGWEAPVYLLAKNAGTVGAGGDLRRYERRVKRENAQTFWLSPMQAAR